MARSASTLVVGDLAELGALDLRQQGSLDDVGTLRHQGVLALAVTSLFLGRSQSHASGWHGNVTEVESDLDPNCLH